MKKETIHIKFENQQNPNAAFDILQLEEFLTRTDLDHSPLKLHLVEFYIIALFLDGKGAHTIDFTDYPYQKGTLLTIRKDQIHKFINGKNASGLLLLFTDDFLVSYLENLETQKSLQLFNELLGTPKFQLNQEELNEISSLIERMQKEYFNINDNYSLGIIRSELHILIAKLYRIKSKNNLIISNRKYLNEFVAFQKLVEDNVIQHSKVLDYAKMMGLSTKTLNTVTKAIINKTAKEFIDEIYTKKIKRLLINTEDTIKEIAYLSGFEETTNFYKYFKRQTQLTPEQFRESAK